MKGGGDRNFSFSQAERDQIFLTNRNRKKPALFLLSQAICLVLQAFFVPFLKYGLNSYIRVPIL